MTIGKLSHAFKLGGTDSVAYAWIAETLRSLMPQLQTIGVPTAEIGIDTLEDRLRKAAIEAGTAVGVCSTPESGRFAAAHLSD
jgi:hypothetical protein